MTSISCHGTITKENLHKAIEDCKKYGPHRLTLSRQVSSIMTELGWIWSLEGGNLLGAWRNGKMLAHDDDFDFMVYCGELNTNSNDERKIEVLGRLRDAICEKLPSSVGVRIIISYSCKLEVYMPEFGKYPLSGKDFHNVTCDITVLAPVSGDESQLIVMHSNNLKFDLRLSREDILPVIKDGIEYEGYKYNCPANTETFLTSLYGYLGPNHRFDSTTGKYVKNE